MMDIWEKAYQDALENVEDRAVWDASLRLLETGETTLATIEMFMMAHNELFGALCEFESAVLETGVLDEDELAD